MSNAPKKARSSFRYSDKSTCLELSSLKSEFQLGELQLDPSIDTGLGSQPHEDHVPCTDTNCMLGDLFWFVLNKLYLRIMESWRNKKFMGVLGGLSTMALVL